MTPRSCTPSAVPNLQRGERLRARDRDSATQRLGEREREHANRIDTDARALAYTMPILAFFLSMRFFCQEARCSAFRFPSALML